MKQILSASMFKREETFRLATLLLLIVSLWATASQSRAATINVPGDQSTIAAAITAASPGDIVQLTASISEGLVTINKAITLNGGGFTLTSTSVTWGVNPTVPGVTILNLTVTGAGTFGIITAPGAGNLVITNTTVSNCGGTGFAFNCVNVLTLTNITATNNVGNGVSITDCNNVTINGITTSGNAFGGGFSAGIGIFSGGGFCAAGTSNVTVTGAVNIGEPLALYEQAASGTITGTSLNPSSGSTSAPTHFAGVANAAKYYATNLATAYTIAASLIAAPSSVSPALVHVEEISSGNKYVNDLLAPAPPQRGTYTLSINAAITYAVAGKTVFIEDGTYNERVIVSKSITLDGQSEAATVLDGTGLVGAGSGISLNNAITNVTIQDLTIRNYAGTSPNSFAGIYAVGGNNNLTVEDCKIHGNVGGSGFYANGPVDNVSLDNLEIFGHSNAFGAARGIVIWNGLKSNISITNCEVYNNNCCGIELQDGTASGVTMSNNNIYNNGDNGIGIVGMQGPGVNVVSNNTLSNNGRFGIELKNPNGSGANSGAGSIVVSGNTVTRNTAIVDARDIAGIAVMRRGVLPGNVDIPTGVVVSGNTVSGYVQPSTSEGFGIVIGGTNHSVTGNTVSGNDVGIQQQAGHLPYPADGDQSNLADQFFGRDNSPATCGNDISGNTLSSNGVDTRNVPASLASIGSVLNTTTNITYCSIQAAINAAATLSGHTLEVSPATYDEQVIVNKGVTIKGVGLTQPSVDFTGTVSGKPTLFDVTADGVSIENMRFNVDMAKLRSAIIVSGVSIDNITIKDNTIDAYGTPAGSYGDRNAVSVNYGGSTNYRVAAGGVNSVTFTGNTINNSLPLAFFRSGISADEVGGTFSGNTSQTVNHDILLRFCSNGNITIDNNTCNGGGIELAEHNAGAGTISITNNDFDGTFGNAAVTPRTALLRLKNNQQNKATTVSGNTFVNHRFGLSIENYPNVTVDDNTFSPESGSTDYVHIGVNTKSISSNSNTIVQTTVSGAFTNNVFNGTTPVGGTALGFYNHDSDNAAFGTFTIGTAGNENEFNANIAQFIRLDNQTGSSNGATTPTTYPTTTNSGWPTTMAAWSGSMDASNNYFNVGTGLKLPSSMSKTELYSLEDAVSHALDNSGPGFVTVNAGNSYVTTLSASIQRGIDVFATSGAVNIAPGTSFTENIDAATPARDISLAPGASPGCVTVNGNMTLNSGDVLDMEINGTTACTDYDQFAVNGTVTLGGASLNLILGYAPATGHSFTLIDNDLTDAISGQFAQGSVVTANFGGVTYSFTINYAGGSDNNDVVLTFANNVRVYSDLSETILVSTHATIQAAIDAATTLNGYVVRVDEGTYSEAVNVNKELTIRGAGKGSNPASNTVLQAASACSGTAFTVSANNVSLEDMFIKDYNIGVQIGSVSNPVLEDLYIEDHCLYGVSLAGSLAQDISISTSTITRTGAPSTTVGIRAGTANGVDGLLVHACSITNNYQGINIAQATTPSLFTNITIRNSTISNNAIKGMYFEKLNNALLKSLTMNNNGTDAGYGFNNGIDINLKYGSYSNISIEDCDISNSGATGTAADPENPAAIAIKALDDAPNYSGNPATLSNVTLKNNRISGPQNGIRFGEFGKINNSPTGITLEGNDLSHAFVNKAIISRINGNIDLECNWHGSTVPATITAGFTTAGSGLINLNAYLSIGTDASPAVGFQPSGLCICPSVSASITGNSLLCSGASLAYNGNPSGGSGVFSTHSWAQTGGSGSVSISNNNSTANILGVNAGSVTLQYTVVDNQGCASITTSSITVLNCGSITCPASVTVCADAVTNTATVGTGTPGSNGYIDPTDTEAVAGDACGFTTGSFGRSGATSGGGPLVITPTIVSLPVGTVFNAGNTVVSYSVNDGCQQTQTCAFTVVVRRTPLPFFNQTAITICDGAGVNLASYARDSRNVAKRYDFYEDVGGTLQFRGTATATSGNVNFGQNVWVNPAGDPNLPVVHTYYLVATNTFNNGPSCEVQGGPLTVTVNPKPAPPTVPANLSVCPGATVAVPAFSTATPPGVTQFNWSNSNPAIGLAANGTANASPGTAFSFTATGNITGSPISATISVQAVANICVSNPTTFNIVLRPAPLGVPASPAICSGQAVNHSLQASPAATFSWVAASNTSVSGESLTAQSGPDITDVLVNNSSLPQTVIYTVTPTSTDGCEGASFTVSVTVNPLPVLTPGLSVSVCAGENASLALTDVGGIASNFSWTQQSLPANVLQLSGAANGSGSPISGAFIVGGALPASINYSVTPSTASCTGAPATASIVVNPGTVNTLTLSACETTAGSGTGTLNLAAALPGASFYSATLSPIGGSYTGAATTVYAFAPAANPPCLVQTTISIVVNPKPSANVLPANNMICQGSDVLLNGNPAGGNPAYLHNWIAPTGAAFVQIADNGNGTATVTGIAAGMATLQYTVSDQNNCSASASASVEVKAAPQVTAFANLNTGTVAVCQNAPINLSSTIVPVQGTVSVQWTGPSFSSGVANPPAFSLATPALNTYTLVVLDANGCSASSAVSVEVVAPKFAGNANNYGGIYCIADMTPFNLFDILVAQAAPQVVDPTGVWSGVFAPANGSLGTIVPAAFSGIGNYSFFYTVSNPAGCGTSTTAIVNLDIVDCTVPIIYAQPKVFLQGPYNTGTGLMNDGLRSQGLVPLTEPYSNLGYLFTGGGGESIPVSVLNVTGPNAIVDWVVLELRSATNPATVIFSRSALLQRDGDVVDLDGVSPVGFLGIFPGTFHLAVKHRNHLGVMSATAQAFPLYVPVHFNYSQAANPPFGGLPGSSLQLTASLLLMYGGDASFNGQVQNDDVVNFWSVQVGLSGYLRADYNMDGQVQNSDQVFIWTPNSGRGSQIPQ